MRLRFSRVGAGLDWLCGRPPARYGSGRRQPSADGDVCLGGRSSLGWRRLLCRGDRLFGEGLVRSPTWLKWTRGAETPLLHGPPAEGDRPGPTISWATSQGNRHPIRHDRPVPPADRGGAALVFRANLADSGISFLQPAQHLPGVHAWVALAAILLGVAGWPTIWCR
jgi:hypothetical protein